MLGGYNMIAFSPFSAMRYGRCCTVGNKQGKSERSMCLANTNGIRANDGGWE